jgi:hypothetical protein
VKSTNIPVLLSAIADSYSNATDETEQGKLVPSGAAELAAVVRSQLEIHRHLLWRRDTRQPAGWEITTDPAQAEVAECSCCGEIDRDLFWCRHLRAMFAAVCSVDVGLPQQAPEWPNLTEAIRVARRAYEGPVASAVIRSITNPAYPAESRILLAECVLASTPRTPPEGPNDAHGHVR